MSYMYELSMTKNCLWIIWKKRIFRNLFRLKQNNRNIGGSVKYKLYIETSMVNSIIVVMLYKINLGFTIYVYVIQT